MPSNNLNVADGQVAATEGQITAGPADSGQRINVTFTNVGSNQETLVLRLTRGTWGTARRIFKCVLEVDQQLVVCGLPINALDSLLATTTTAASVDYMISLAGQNAPLTITKYDEGGNPMGTPQIVEQLLTMLS